MARLSFLGVPLASAFALGLGSLSWRIWPLEWMACEKLEEGEQIAQRPKTHMKRQDFIPAVFHMGTMGSSYLRLQLDVTKV